MEVPRVFRDALHVGPVASCDAGLLSVNRDALTAFDLLELAGVDSATISAPIMACFEDGAQAKELRHEFELIETAGQHVDISEISGDGARVIVPQIAQNVQAVVQINGQRYSIPVPSSQRSPTRSGSEVGR